MTLSTWNLIGGLQETHLLFPEKANVTPGASANVYGLISTRCPKDDSNSNP